MLWEPIILVLGIELWDGLALEFAIHSDIRLLEIRLGNRAVLGGWTLHCWREINDTVRILNLLRGVLHFKEFKLEL